MATYLPPPAGEIAAAQNETPQLRILVAQRRLYSNAKLWANMRTFGVGIVAIASPIIAASWPGCATAAGAVAAIWYITNRLLLKSLERYYATRAATIQERFDTTIFGMPKIAVRDPEIFPEEIARLSERRPGARRRKYSEERLHNWYPINENVSGRVAIAIAQRANLAYTDALLDRYARLWLVIIVVWAAIAILIGVVADFSLRVFLFTVALPVAPSLLDAVDEWQRLKGASRERRALTLEIRRAIERDSTTPIPPEALIGWQAQLFSLRRDAPLVPDLLYQALRPRCEREMTESADAMG